MADINVIVLPDGTEYPVSDYYLPVAISNPTDGQVLKYDAENQVWYNGEDASGSSVLYGTSAPTSQLGTDGCLYVKYTEGTGGASDTVDALYVKLDGAWCQISTGGGGGASSADQVSVDDTNLEYEADDVQEALEKIYKRMTLAEYEQLSHAEKYNGTIYLITDVKGANQRLTKQISNQAIASFETDLAENLENLEVAITATGGGGTPVSPISINGFSQADIVNMSDITNKTYFEGLLNGTYGFVDLGSLSWNKNNNWGGAPMFATTETINNAKGAASLSSKANAICYIYETQSRDYIYVNTNVDAFNLTDIGYLQIRTTTSYATENDFQTAMNGVYLIYELLTPTTPTITKAQFETLLSAFSINGSIETIPFGQTVYGGRLNVRSGVLNVTHAIKTFDGSESFGTMSGQRCVINISEIKVNPLSQIDDLICSHYETVTQGASGDNYVYKAGENTAVVFRDSVHCVDVATFQAYLANQYSNGTPVQLVYWLATPLTIQLDSKQIQVIIGTNNVYADTGDIIDLKFVLSVGQAIS